MHTFALIPAAGKSRRMGKQKLLLDVRGKTVLEHVIAAMRSGGVTAIIVVVAPDAAALAELATRAGAHAVRLPEDTPDMRTTCEHGLAWIEERYHPRSINDSWILMPADHPTVRPNVIRELRLIAYLPSLLMQADLGVVESTPSIIVPTFEGRRGHPTLLRWSHAAAIRSWPRDQGLNAYIRAQAEETDELPWPTDEILRDLDTPADYERLLSEPEA